MNRHGVFLAKRHYGAFCMSGSHQLAEIERQINSLPRKDQLWLIERLAQQLRETDPGRQSVSEDDLAAMASDPEVQREIRAINAEFGPTEQDGLEGL
jgi:hypothetical protein